ncbi:hypothetical protein VTJ83DRAFT_3283 [Remersonia thermophila]|uniref:Circumsporozoite protein n=1 Tax=Remersonia thermophila TaxID=72144 RepID=A0ABR4DDV8_9PEZI
MFSKVVALIALAAYAEARFGQEQAVANLVQGLGNFGQPGQAATLAGQTPGVLLAGANACAKLQLADQIVATLGNDPAVIDAARALVAAEKNTNPFAVAIPSICSDRNLPATPELRGIVPLVDPDTVGSDVENANAARSLQNPFNADGLSVAEVAIANGFSNFTLQGSDGSTAPAAGAGNNGGNNNNNNNNGNNGNNNNNNGNNGNNNNNNNNGASRCGAVQTTLTTVIVAPTGNAGDNNRNNNGGAVTSSIAGLDFGSCDPTIKFVGGLGNRPATEFTFQSREPQIASKQQEALNPNIITNRICDDLTNICGANQAAKDRCRAAQAEIQALGTRNADTARRWNELLGFAGADISS